ncbi:MAG: MaoC/PaaZ C-terminal domain-containing protein [Streptosporangiaceae bacterium]
MTTQRPGASGDYYDLVGTTYEGEPFVITREERDAFERVTWIDRAYPDPDPAGFPEDMIEGFHSLALLDAVSRLASPSSVRRPGVGYNYGLDRVRFTSPIHIGDRLRSRFEVTDVRPRGRGYVTRRHCEVTVDGAGRPALVADWLTMWLPEP